MRSSVSKKNQERKEEAEVTSQFAALLCNQLLEKSPNSFQEFIRAHGVSNEKHLYLRTHFQQRSMNYLIIITKYLTGDLREIKW